MITRDFTSFPILTTERLTLRQLSMDDQQNIFALRSDKEINKYLVREPSKTIEDAINFINRITENSKKKQLALLGNYLNKHKNICWNNLPL